ncbi:hypothetical protein vseg_006811 [Gypsophila vaccaria]
MWRGCVGKTVEALTRMAVKRACKFALKKKLGHLILGDIDVDQLDVQLALGVVNLCDLALDVDLINRKLTDTCMFRLREGSVGSLSVKLPWNDGGAYQVELHDLELVVCPLADRVGSAPNDSHKAPGSTSASVPPPNVHEGVKAVAKWVQHLVTRFNVKVNNLIVAFDPGVLDQSLVLRVSEIECGTSVSQDDDNDLIGMSSLAAFLRFDGAAFDLLHLTTTDSSTNVSKPVVTGDRHGVGGFGGTLDLSIPCKEDGCLDIHKVDGHLHVQPFIAKLDPPTLRWMLATSDMLQELDSSMLPPTPMPMPTVTETPFDFQREHTFTDMLLNDSQFISDWIPHSSSTCHNDDADLGASVDKFFECLDEMRSSHSVLGGSGMWNWTSSVFSALTAASNLASGSPNMSAEQQHVQTNLKITFVGVSAIFCFLDEDQSTEVRPSGDRHDTDPIVHHLGSIWEDILVAIQVFPQDWKLDATVKRIVLNEYICQKGHSVESLFHDHVNDHSGQTQAIRDLQEKVQKALPYSSVFGEASNVKGSDALNNVEVPCSFQCPTNWRCSSNLVTTTLFETSGVTRCLFAASSGSSSECSTGQSSLTLELPPFTFWLCSDLINLVLDLVRKLDDFPRKSKSRTAFSSQAPKKQASDRSNVTWSSNLQTTSTPNRGALVGSVFLPHGRIILCFPWRREKRLRSIITSWNEFIILDFSSPSQLTKLKPEVHAPVRDSRHQKQDSTSPSHSLQLNAVNLALYHVTSLEGVDDVGTKSPKFCARRILSVGNKTDWVCLISMFWRVNAVTGAWVKKSAELFATSDDQPYKKSSDGFEFSSVSSSEHGDDPSLLKNKLMLSSKSCLHVCLPSTVVILSRSQYICLLNLVHQAIDLFSVIGDDTDHENLKTAISQTSIFVECGVVEVHMELGQGNCPKSSLQRELPGSWHSLRLEVRNLEVLHVSDVGAVRGAHFLWLFHCEGKLWGSICKGELQDFMLISFSNSANGRGGGDGSNVLSSRSAGSKFVHMSDPESSHDFMSLVLKCGTVVAPGGRLDWLDKLSSFFSLPSPDSEVDADCMLKKGNPKGHSFVIKFLDAALSYEPYFGKPDINEECGFSKSHVYVNLEDRSHDPHVACVLAASSLMLSSTAVADSLDNDYSIRLQDVGLLLHEVSSCNFFLGEYSAGFMREAGYVKVAEEALINALLRINYEVDISWELQCSETNIVLRTCHDTTFGLIRLAGQIQQLFAPDIEESLVHLQNRWNFFQETRGRDDIKGSSETSSSCSPRKYESQHLVPDLKNISELAGLMGDICEDAFLLTEKGVGSCNGSQLKSRCKMDGGPSSDERAESYLETGQTKSEIMEGYCLSDLRSLSELAISSHSGDEISKLNLMGSGSPLLQDENSGWYGRTPISIVENYVADRTERTCLKQFVERQQYDKEHNGNQLCKGRVLLKNAKVKWQMYAGSDWGELGQSRKICGRDGSLCLELAFFNMNIQYDIFPDGNISASKLCASVQDFYLSDQSRNAPWKLVLGYYHSKERPRESFSKAFKLDLEAVRPDPTTPLEEYRLRIAVLPILLHLHQSQLDFLVSFFGNKQSPVDQHGDTDDSGRSDECLVGDNKVNDDGIIEEALLPFFQKFEIWPIVAKVDYCPSRVDLAALSSGKYVELVNLVPWKGVELQLKHVQAAGVYGWTNVCETAMGEWLEDISQNQIHKLLRGLPTIRSFVTVGSGAAKLLSSPVKSYRKDYKLVKGLQRGTISFLRSISVEALGLGVHLVAGAHEILLHAEYILTRMQPSVPRPVRSKMKLNRGSEQPQDAQHGLQQACESLGDGFGKSAAAVIHNPMKTYRRDGSAGSALVTAFKGAPVAAIAPASAAAQALHFALVGVRNSLDPERKEESMNKYLGPYHSKC